MPNKSINHGILKKYHSKDTKKIINHYQNYQINDLLLQGEKGRGIDIGKLTDFSSSSNGYNEKKRVEGDKPKPQRAPDNLRKYLAPPPRTEKNPHFLFRHRGLRKDANEIVNN